MTRITFKPMDFTASAVAAVAAMVGLERDLTKYTERRTVRPKLFMVAIPTSYTDDGRVYLYIKEHTNVVGSAVKKNTTVIFFCMKEEAKMFRDLCNKIFPNGEIVRVHYGPDHHRYVGEVK